MSNLLAGVVAEDRSLRQMMPGLVLLGVGAIEFAALFALFKRKLKLFDFFLPYKFNSETSISCKEKPYFLLQDIIQTVFSS